MQNLCRLLVSLVMACAAIALTAANASTASAQSQLQRTLPGRVPGRGRGTVLDNRYTRAFFPGPPELLSIEPASGRPPAARVVRDGKLVGYVFSTFDVSGSLGFSGKPIDMHVGLTLDGHIAGARMVRHQEPILILGISPKTLNDYVAAFKGFDIRSKLVAGKATPGLPDGVSGASVSSGVIRDAIIRSARNVAIGHGLFTGQGGQGGQGKIDRTSFTHKTWQALLGEGAVSHRKLTLAEVNKSFGAPPGDNPDGTFIDLYAALLTPPAIGQNLLKRLIYNNVIGKSGVGDNLIMIAANGLYSFRGRAWRRSGIFDRIEIVQGPRTFRLTKSGYRLVASLHAAGAPVLREIAVFTLPASSGFDPTRKWRINLLVARSSGANTGVEQLRSFSLRYKLPAAYIIAPPQPSFTMQLNSDPRLWLQYWVAQKFRVAILMVMLTLLTAILFFQDALARRKTLYIIVRGGFLVATLLFLGLYAGAQLSVLNVITFIHALMGGFRWDLFLLNPLVFILWSFVAVAMLFWGRGVYCGWLCPFGALQELVNMVARNSGIRQIKLPWGLHERLWPIKYVIFLAILAISLSSMTWAFRLAEVEPFKTVIILKFMREWQFVIYALALLAVGLYVERFYCRYLCPLGAALAIPARMRMFEWLKRRHQCGHECNICATRCTVQAIHPMGQINPNECVYCLRCQVTYYDATTCRVLKDRARRRRGRGPASTPSSAKTNATPDRPAGELPGTRRQPRQRDLVPALQEEEQQDKQEQQKQREKQEKQKGEDK